MKFHNAILRGAFLPNSIYMVGGAGSRYGNTYYGTINNFVKCGCWDDDNGKTRIESKNNNISSANVIKDADVAMKEIEKLVWETLM